VKEYDIFVPLYRNDGSPIDSGSFDAIQDRLLDEFDGLTFFPQPNQGYWRMGNVVYRDEIVIFRVVSDRRSARRFLRRLKEELKTELEQEEILIIERDVGTL
jgi:hypothetical protein